MMWLPCIRRGSDRWWLPRLPESTDTLAKVLLGRDHPEGDRGLQREVADALVHDPPLFLYCALHSKTSESGQSSETTVDELAQWLIDNALDKFSNGDAFLAAPDVSEPHQRQTRRFLDHYRALPIHRWMEDAVLWLEAFGPKVSSTWQHQWPTIAKPSSEASFDGRSSEPGHRGDVLQLLARTVQRQRSLETGFDQRLQHNKLTAIKQLAYGLSHEINNPLANISTRAQSLQRDEQDPKRAETLQRIVDQVYRAHEMIADLMFYSNPPQAHPEPCDGVEMLREVIATFAEETERLHIRVETSLPAGLDPWNVDRTMIGEAVRVLIRNAMEAIGTQGTIVVSVTRHGQSTQIHVADSGPGLSADAQLHAFDPYFSGREAGRGLGLGLCRAYRIAKLHQADIHLASGPVGCVATITLHDQNESLT